jgi:hypothetical protein
MVITLFGFLVLSCGCKKPAETAGGRVAEAKGAISQDLEEPPTVVFELKTTADNDAVLSFDCTYAKKGKIARFGLDFSKGPESGDLHIASAHGRFRAVANSDNSVLLEDLQKALLAKKLPKVEKTVQVLSFDGAVLGQNQSRNDSGFHDKPRGDWILLKVFLPQGGDEGEFFLNLNPIAGKGEFSIKDEDYGDYVLNELAKVL